jgi:hypothetical protein
MDRIVRVVIAMTSTIALAPVADSADFVTSLVNCTGRYFGCFAFNAADKPADVIVESSGIQTPLTLLPGEFYTPSNP